MKKGYDRHDFADVFARYPRSEPSQPSQPNTTRDLDDSSSRHTPVPVTGPESATSPSEISIVTDVTAQEAGDAKVNNHRPKQCTQRSQIEN
jgi:hypothetical protein